MSPRIIFAGTPEFSIPTLQALLDHSYDIVGVYTQPDRPAGRGQHLTESPIKRLAKQYHLPVYQPTTLRDIEAQNNLAALNPDVLVVVAYGLLLPPAVLKTPRWGCINVHASLLPRWCGAAPIQHAILAGDPYTGVSIMQMNEGLDTGDILSEVKCDILPEDNSETMHYKLANLGASALIDALKELFQHTLHPRKQDDHHSTYAPKISKLQAKIDWTKPASQLLREIKAFNPWPVSFTYWNGEMLRIWDACLGPTKEFHAQAGTLLQANKQGLEIATGDGTITALKIQRAGGKIATPQDFINAFGKSLVPNVTSFT